LTGKAEAFLNKKYLAVARKRRAVPLKAAPWVYFNHATLKELNLKQPDVRAHAGRLVPKQPAIERAFTRTES